MQPRPGIEPLGRSPLVPVFGRKLPPGLKLLLIQAGAAALWLFLFNPMLAHLALHPEPWLHAISAGAIAALLGHAWRLPSWWLPINLFFIPGMLAMSGSGIAAHWYLAIFALLLLVYWSVARTQVPLYLSSRQAWCAVADRLPPQVVFADLGSGLGGLPAFLSRVLPEGRFTGIETAPLPFLISRLRAMLDGERYEIRWGSFWKQDLSRFDVVYAYLSPVPMSDLWCKARAEMRSGSLLISNTFAVPGVEPSEVLQLEDLHRSRLYLYRL